MVNSFPFPPGTVLSSALLASSGFDKLKQSRMARSGALDRLAQGVYQVPRPSGGSSPLSPWDVLLSLANSEDGSFHVGGRTALSLQGFSHYLPLGGEPVQAFGHEVPRWVRRLESTPKIIWRNSKLFEDPILGIERRSPLSLKIYSPSPDWTFPLSSPERAILEAISLLPAEESLHVVDMAMESLTTMRPRLLAKLLSACTSKVTKRMFMVLAERHGHAWLEHLDVSQVDFGTGNRSLFPGGRLHRRWQLVLPADMFEREGNDGPEI